MRKVNITGKVIRVFPVRTFERQGKENKVANCIIADDTSNIRIVLWDVNHIALLENEEVKEGVTVNIPGSVRASFGMYNNAEDVKRLIRAVRQIAANGFDHYVKKYTFDPRNEIWRPDVGYKLL